MRVSADAEEAMMRRQRAEFQELLQQKREKEEGIPGAEGVCGEVSEGSQDCPGDRGGG